MEGYVFWAAMVGVIASISLLFGSATVSYTHLTLPTKA